MSTREGYHWGPRTWSPSDVQARVLDGVARGLTNAAIAAEVGMSPDGVKWHVGRALSETGLDGRRSLALWWQSPKTDIDFRLSANPPTAEPVKLDYGPSLRVMAGFFDRMGAYQPSLLVIEPPILSF